MNLTESINGFKSYGLNTRNTFSGPSWLVMQPNDDLGTQVPANFTTAQQNIAFSNIEAGQEYMAIQDGNETSYQNCTSQESGFCGLAANFSVPVRVNLTSVWLRYGAVQDGAYPPPIPLNVETDYVEPNSLYHIPSGDVLGNGTLQYNAGHGWNEVQIRTSSGAPVTLEPKTTYWLVMDGSTIPTTNAGYYEWYSVSDSGGGWDEKGAAFMIIPGEWVPESWLFWQDINFLSVLFVRAVDASYETMEYSSPAEVGMALNGIEINGTTMRVNASWTSFQFTTNCSVTFTANWTARFEYPRGNVVSTQYIANQDLTYWNASFTSVSKPNDTLFPYTWYNKTLKVSTVPKYWNVSNPSSDVLNNRSINFNFLNGSGYFLINQTSNLNGEVYWNADWLIKAQSSYWASATSSSQIVAGLPLPINISTALLNPPSSHCNVTFYSEATGYPVYSRNHTIPSNPYLLQIRLNQSGSYTAFLFDTWDYGNEVSFCETLTVTVLEPRAVLALNATEYEATYGDSIPVEFAFLNTTGSSPQPFTSETTLYRNGTPVSFTTVWKNPYVYVLNTRDLHQAGTYHLNFTAECGVYVATNVTMVTISKIPMNITMTLDQRSVAANSSLSVSAMLEYPNRTKVEDYTKISFNFTVTYIDNAAKVFEQNATTINGEARSAFTTTMNMTRISVDAFYAGDDMRSPAKAPRQDVTVTQPTVGFSLAMVVGTGIGGALVVVATILVAMRRRKGEERRAMKESRLAESGSLAQLVVVDKISGRNVWSRKLGTKEGVNPHLASGFLSANESVLGVLFKSGEAKGGLKFADYGNYRVIGEAGKHIMTALFCTETAGPDMRNAVAEFTKRFETKYEGTLRRWKGNMDAFKGAKRIFDEVFPLTTTSRYAIDEEKLRGAKLSRIANESLDRAKRLSATKGFFFMSKIIEFLETEKGKKRSAVADILDELSRAGIFKQVTVEEAEEMTRNHAKTPAKPRGARREH